MSLLMFSGLGLAISKNLVEMMGGKVNTNEQKMRTDKEQSMRTENTHNTGELTVHVTE